MSHFSFEDAFTDGVDDIRERLFTVIQDLYPNENERPTLREIDLMWSIMQPVSFELETFYAKLNEALELSFIQFSREPYLDYRGEEVDLDRLAATTSTGTVRFMGVIDSVVPSGTGVSTVVETSEESPVLFNTTEEGILVGMDDPTVVPTTVAGSAGNISGDAVYKYVYVTNLNTPEPTRGYTLPSPPSTPVLTVAAKRIEVTIPSIVWAPTEDLIDVLEVRVYRSYKSVSDTEFSAYKYVGSLVSNPKDGGVVTDNVSDAAFLLLDDNIEGEEGVPTTNTTGVIDVAAASEEAGAEANVIAGAISLLEDDTIGIEKVTNPEDFAGGSDAEPDADYSDRLLEAAQNPPGAGNIADYITWAKSIDGIYSVNVLPEWDGPGTVKVVVAGQDNAIITDEDKIEEVRQYIAGDVAIEDPTTNAMTLTPSNAAGTIALGDYEYVYTFVNSTGGETEPSPVEAVTLAGAEDTVTITTIPLGPTGSGPENTAARRIYRKFLDEADPVFDLVTELEDNTTTSYTDITPQGSLPADAEPSGDPLTAREAPLTNTTSLYNGQAPIGSHVTVHTITPISIYVEATIVPEEGYSIAGTSGTVNLTTKLNEALEAFFDGLTPGTDVKYKDVENVIHDTEGVDDFSLVTLFGPDPYDGGVTTNIPLSADETVDFDTVSTLYTEGS